MRSFFLLFLCAGRLWAADPRAGNTVVLDETGVKNLRLETVEATEGDFEETLFALGRIEAIPVRMATLSSRVAGRVAELKVQPGDMVEAGQEVAGVESRQAGHPPPVIPLKAPLGGLVVSVEVHLGDPIDPDKPILEISDLREVHAIARVPEHYAGRLQPGTTTAHIKAAALPGEKFEGKLLRFGTTADAASGTIDAVFALENPRGLLRAGMRAEFSIVLGKRGGVTIIPRTALQGEPSNRFVYVKDFDLPNAFVKTPVVVGEMNDRFVEIIGGLLPADEVVTNGAYSLAFAGGGSVSLKEALDAAHGHPHNEDGSEITPGRRDGHEHGEAPGGEGPFWKIASAVLFVALLVSLFFRKPLPC